MSDDTAAISLPPTEQRAFLVLDDPEEKALSESDRKKALIRSIVVGDNGVELATFGDYLAYAGAIHTTQWAPNGMSIGDLALSMIHGKRLGLDPLQSIQSIAVIKARPVLWGDSALAIVLSSGKLKEHKEWFKGTGDTLAATCSVHREGMEHPYEWTYTVEDAKTAGLWGPEDKTVSWHTAPRRMMMMRARAFALRGAFPDVLAGMSVREEFDEEPTATEEKESGGFSGSDPLSDDGAEGTGPEE